MLERLSGIPRRLVPIVDRATCQRGDVPGWVLIVLMTSALVLVIWGIASDHLSDIVKSAFDTVCDGFGC